MISTNDSSVVSDYICNLLTSAAESEYHISAWCPAYELRWKGWLDAVPEGDCGGTYIKGDLVLVGDIGYVYTGKGWIELAFDPENNTWTIQHIEPADLDDTHNEALDKFLDSFTIREV